MITRVLDGQLNEKFGLEYIKILEKTLSIIRDNMIQEKPKD
jgi:hypothetical protein